MLKRSAARCTLGLLLAVMALLSVATANQGAAQKPTLEVRIGLLLPEVAPGDNSLYATAVKQAENGARMAIDELGANAEMVGQKLVLVAAHASSAAEAQAAADKLVKQEKVMAVITGIDDAQLDAVKDTLAAAKIPIMNIGATSDTFRNGLCERYLLHVQASASMYLDALTDWFVRAQLRDWYYIYETTDESKAQVVAARGALSQRHFAGGEKGAWELEPNAPIPEDMIKDIGRREPDVILMLLPAERQLELLKALDGLDMEVQVTGFPYTETQMRAFLVASKDASSKYGAGYRGILWEAKIDAYGARELNVRYNARFKMPMDGPSWAAYQSVKMLYEAAAFGGGVEADKLIAYFESENTNFDVYKGIGLSFRPWDHQMREPLYLVKVAENASAKDLWNAADLVGELPALYLQGTDPLERLDQLGQLQADSECQMP